MEHYICTGNCKGVSERQGICGDEKCPKFGQPLIECDCGDMKHNDFRGKNAEGDSEVSQSGE
jgi:hypothetical protein